MTERNASGGAERSWYQRWLATDPLLPGVTYIAVYCGGSLITMFSPKLAMWGLLFYVLFAMSVNIGAQLEVRSQDTDSDRDGGDGDD